MPDLLIELFSEEIPARMQARAGEDLKKRMTDGLVEAGLTYASAAAFTTPRRLVLTVEGVLDQSPSLREERKGPRVDAPEKAIEGFLRGAGVTRADLEERDEKKGRVFYAVIERPGRPATDIIAEVLDHTIRNFPWPKSMRWGTGSLRWVRPLQSILCILSAEDGAQTVPLEVDGIVAGDCLAQFLGPGPEPVGGNNFGEDAQRPGPLGAQTLVTADERHPQDRLHRRLLGQADGLERRDLADRDVRVEDCGVLGRDHDVGVGHEVQSAAGADPVDRSDHRFGHAAVPGGHAQLGVAGLARAAPQRLLVPRQLGHVEAGLERRSVPGGHDRRNVPVGLQLGPCRVEVEEHLRVDGVALLGPVELQPRDRSFAAHRQRLVGGHGTSSRRSSVPASLRGSRSIVSKRVGTL